MLCRPVLILAKRVSSFSSRCLLCALHQIWCIIIWGLANARFVCHCSLQEQNGSRGHQQWAQWFCLAQCHSAAEGVLWFVLGDAQLAPYFITFTRYSHSGRAAFAQVSRNRPCHCKSWPHLSLHKFLQYCYWTSIPPTSQTLKIHPLCTLIIPLTTSAAFLL